MNSDWREFLEEQVKKELNKENGTILEGEWLKRKDVCRVVPAEVIAALIEWIDGPVEKIHVVRAGRGGRIIDGEITLA